ncbi:MAG: hypothetical protein O7F73_02295 [Gammaproteobacteria bacterium]|nr:hypothetical protein [Gammaproteobacteria bacterium]
MEPSRLQYWISRYLGGLLLLVGVSVFLIRLHHDGPYAMPAGGNLFAGVLALALGFSLVAPWSQGSGKAVPLVWLSIVAGPVILFFALYATLAELEEVISIKAFNREGKPASLRLWVVDYDGRPWVTMPGSKSDNHGLEDGPIVMFRDGVDSCVLATRLDDRETVDDIHRRRHQKYMIQRLATVVGLFGETAGAETVTLRLDPCS